MTNTRSFLRRPALDNFGLTPSQKADGIHSLNSSWQEGLPAEPPPPSTASSAHTRALSSEAIPSPATNSSIGELSTFNAETASYEGLQYSIGPPSATGQTFLAVPDPLARSRVFTAHGGSFVCPLCQRHFSRDADLRRHHNNKHDRSIQHWCRTDHCPRSRSYVGIGKPFPRKDKRDEHERRRHGRLKDQISKPMLRAGKI